MTKKKEIIVRVKFSDSTVMLFGNSYKPWVTQLDEYLWLLKQKEALISVDDVTISDDAWVGWGGLKWCPEKDFQNQLNREGCQTSDSDNPNPRLYDEMTFYKNGSVTKKVNKMVNNYYVNIY